MERPIEHLVYIVSALKENKLFSPRTISSIEFELLRLKTRLNRLNDSDLMPHECRLHLGCGSRLIQGWLNVDIDKSDYNVDLACGRLPWKSDVFEAIVSQHFIEHLELMSEFIPLLRELHRILIPGGQLWLSCPDIAKICRSYMEFHMKDLLADTKKRWPNFSLGAIPTSHMINHLFHQNGEHKNLYDFKLLDWALKISGFKDIEQSSETGLRSRFPEFPERKDDLQSIYVQAKA